MTPRTQPAGKRAWREAGRRARRALDRDAWSEALVRALRGWPRYLEAETVAVFLATPEEPDLSELHGDGARVVAPRMEKGQGPLALHVLDERRVRHPFGMHEPPSDAPRVAPGEVDVFLVPGLAFDLGGGRLGYGAGHYDRLLARARPDAALVGVAHPELLAASLPLEPHDVRMTHLVLPGGVWCVADGVMSDPRLRPGAWTGRGG